MDYNNLTGPVAYRGDNYRTSAGSSTMMEGSLREKKQFFSEFGCKSFPKSNVHKPSGSR